MICNNLTWAQSNSLYIDVLEKANFPAMKSLCLEDLFFLLTVALKRKDANHPWLYERCREVEKNPNNCLDLWAREHYKSTIITFAKTIQDILKDPELTVGIFSHTRPIAKDFLEQIKNEFENNTFLKDLFPEVLYQNPRRESPSWSLDGGITVRRSSNPKENTVEAWGLVDGQPTGKHFQLLIYDDVVTLASINTPEMIDKTTNAFEMSLNLGDKRRGSIRGIGTRYHFNDTYRVIMEKGTLSARIHPATDNGRSDGKPVFLTQEQLDETKKRFGPYVFGSQMLLDPVSDKAMGFKKEWLRYYDRLGRTSSWNFYILVDPAGQKKKGSDYTAVMVVGLAPDENYYLVDGIYDRLNLTERTARVFSLVRKWKPIAVGYEQYGLQSDIEHMEYEMEKQNYRFNILPLGGSIAKEDRIRRLVPAFEQGRFWFPRRHIFVNYENKVKDLTALLTEEFISFPVAVHDDGMDCLCRICDEKLGAIFPEIINNTSPEGEGKLMSEYKLFSKGG